MTDPILLLLVERLLWPIPRVRWEAARSLARLIREKETEAANALINWIRNRRLESEAALGLSIIDAFDLGGYLMFADVSQAIRAPSILSNYLLKNNYDDAGSLSPDYCVISPSQSAMLPEQEEAWFDKYRQTAIPRLFSCELERLQQLTHFPFLERWKHDWCWLQAFNSRPETKHPSFFAGVHRNYEGQFNNGQRELYISAYLRTLAFAMVHGMPSDLAEFYARYALSLNRGLADLEPAERPKWARDLLPYDAGRSKELARKLWERAEETARPDEELLALRIVDFDEETFIELDISMAIGPYGFTEGPAESKTLEVIGVDESPGAMVGLVDREIDADALVLNRPHDMTQRIMPEALGHIHIDMALNIRLASLDIFGTPARVKCGPYEIRLETESGVFSRWVHWYSDWEPLTHRDLRSTVNSMTTVSKNLMTKLSASAGMEIARLVRVRRATKREIHLEIEAVTEAFWM